MDEWTEGTYEVEEMERNAARDARRDVDAWRARGSRLDRMAAAVDAAILLTDVVGGRFPQAALDGLAGNLREVSRYLQRAAAGA